MLSRQGIIKGVKRGDIFIENFDEDKCNPNSYNLTLSDKLKIYSNMSDGYKMYLSYDDHYTTASGMVYSSYNTPNSVHHNHCKYCLDVRKDNPVIEINIDKDNGIVIYPGILYLGSTNEFTKTKHLVPKIAGRSSLGRLGLEIYSTADFGDNGFEGKWTLQLSALHPLRIYPNMEICQIYYEPLDDYDRDVTEPSNFYHGKYQNQNGPTASKIYLDRSLKNNED